MIKFKIIYLHELSRGIITAKATFQRCTDEKQTRIYIATYKRTTTPKEVSIKLQSNFTETTHQHRHSPTNSNSID